jgi:dihydropteroate synthase
VSNLNRIEIPDIKSARKFITEIGCDPRSIDIMAPKAVFRALIIEGVSPVDAVIIKQDMLSIGGEVAIPKNVFERKEDCRILVMGTLRQLENLVDKLYRHHPRIRKIANELKKFVEEEYGTKDRKEDI